MPMVGLTKSSRHCCPRSVIKNRRLLGKYTFRWALSNKLRPRQTQQEIDARSLRLIWIDCEMSGLDVNTKHLLEVACMVTEGDSSLQIVAKAPDLIIHQPEEVLNEMDEWSMVQHAKSGLTDEVRKSSLTLEQAEEQLYQFLKLYTPEGKCPLAGNTCGRDRVFLEKYMPKLANHLHYRNVDVSSFKEMFRALEDIEASRKEMLHYIRHLF